MNKQDVLNNLDQVKKWISEAESEPTKKEYACPGWGYKADLTDEFLTQTMTIDGVKYHRHKNGGGWVSEKAQVEDTVWVGVFAVVHNGVIKDQVIIHDRAVVDCDNLQEGTDSNLSGSAQVYGSARVYGSAQVYDSAWVYDSARVYGSAWVYDSAQVYGSGYLKKSTSEDIELKNGETIE